MTNYKGADTLIDVSGWEKDMKRQASGTRAKFWLVNPDPNDNTLFLFKIPRENTGEFWAEFIASKLGRYIGVNTMDAEIASYNNTIGTIARNFVGSNEELNEGGDLFFRLTQDFDRYRLEYYDFLNIIKVLSEYDLEKDFISIPIFDAFIGNQDRHCDNWGIINSNNGYKLSPIYDNGASMGFNLSQEHVEKLLRDERMFKGYCNRGRSLIGLPEKRKPKYIDLLSIMKRNFPIEGKKEMEKINKVNQPLINKILNEIPSELMKDIYKEWVLKLLLYKREWLNNWYGGRYN